MSKRKVGALSGGHPISARARWKLHSEILVDKGREWVANGVRSTQL